MKVDTNFYLTAWNIGVEAKERSWGAKPDGFTNRAGSVFRGVY